jgi:hypothetical protein
MSPPRLYQRARSYDPTTAQFTSTDPVASITRQPFNYTNDNPLNLTDPAGLCSINPFSSSSCVGEAAKAGVHFAQQHPVITGIALGVVAVGTGRSRSRSRGHPSDQRSSP